jgi:hypothetical protein
MPLDDIEKAVDEVASPERFTKWIVRIVLLSVLIGTGIAVAKVAWHMVHKVETATTDRTWFVNQKESIDSAAREEQAAREALQRHQADVESRSGLLSWSHSDDRATTQRLNQQILDAERRRLNLVSDYNTRAGEVADPSYLEGLPKHIERK